MKATQYGKLGVIPDCYISIPTTDGSGNTGVQTIELRALPELSDSKQAIYNNEAIIGRSIPLYTYSHSGDRQIHIQIHFFVTDQSDIQRNLQDKRAIESAVYPRRGDNGSPYKPPPICTIRFGQLLSVDDPLCVVLQSYSVKYPTEVIWDEATKCPYKFDMDTSWLSVYTSNDLPYQDRILTSGR